MEGICLGIKILSYHGYKPFEYAYLIYKRRFIDIFRVNF